MKSMLSRVKLFAAPWTVACQAPLSIEFSQQEYWSGLPFPSPGDFPDVGWNPCLFRLLHCRRILYRCAIWEAMYGGPSLMLSIEVNLPSSGTKLTSKLAVGVNTKLASWLSNGSRVRLISRILVGWVPWFSIYPWMTWLDLSSWNLNFKD